MRIENAKLGKYTTHSGQLIEVVPMNAYELKHHKGQTKCLIQGKIYFLTNIIVYDIPDTV